jgi:hypothetical protein
MENETREDLTQLQSDAETAQGPPEKRPPKMQSTFSLPRSGPEVLSKILKAYVIASKQGADSVKYTDVAAVMADVHPTVVSGNNAFLAEAGFIIRERHGYYKPSPEVTDYAKQAPWDEENAKGHIRALIDKTWFGETVLQQLQLQSTLNRPQLVRAFGIKATPDPSDSDKLGLLVDFLQYFEYLETDERGDFIARPKDEQTVEGSHAFDAYVVKNELPADTRPLPSQPSAEVTPGHIICHVNFNLSVTPGTTDEELESLVKKAKAAINLLTRQTD